MHLIKYLCSNLAQYDQQLFNSLRWKRFDNKITEACSAYFVGADDSECDDYFIEFLSLLNFTEVIAHYKGICYRNTAN